MSEKQTTDPGWPRRAGRAAAGVGLPRELPPGWPAETAAEFFAGYDSKKAEIANAR